MNRVDETEHESKSTRRGFVGWAAMLTSLVASYGVFGAYALRFIFPRSTENRLAKMFVTFASDVPALIARAKGPEPRGSGSRGFSPSPRHVLLNPLMLLFTGNVPNNGPALTVLSCECPAIARRRDLPGVHACWPSTPHEALRSWVSTILSNIITSPTASV